MALGCSAVRRVDGDGRTGRLVPVLVEGVDVGHASKALRTVLLGAGLLSVWSPAPPVHAANSIVTVDSAENVGSDTSVVLDAAGNPVVSYYDAGNGDLKVAHCDDPNCGGGGDSVVTVDSAGNVGLYTSLVLDAAGNPVVSYYDDSLFNHVLKVVHCDDPNCAGGNESIVTVDTAGRSVGWFTSVVLDAAGNPVVSYWDADNHVLKVVHCDDPNCAGGGESNVTVDSAGDVGWFTSVVLDAAGNPVVSSYDAGNGDLKVVHCDDPNCAGGNESIVTVDSAGDVGGDTSRVLDAAGNPIVSYRDLTNGDLKVVHCDDPNCAGGNESLVTVDSDGFVGGFTSLVLDGAGNPVVSYYDADNGDLKVVHCDDANCAGGNERIVTVDSAGNVGSYTSVVLDAAGNPVVSYWDSDNGDLKVAHCDRAACVDLPPVTSIATDPGTPDGANGWYRSPVSVSAAATDDEGVVETRCELDPVAVPVSFADLPAGPCAIGTVAVDGEHTVYAGSVDAAGNTDLVQVAFRIDRTAPRASIRLNPAVPDGARGWYVDPVTVSVRADEPGVTLRCVVDPVSAPTSFRQLPSRPCTTFTVSRYGHHRVYAAAADPAGNVGPIAATAFKSVGALRCDGQVPTRIGTSGADVIVGTPGRDVIVARGGNDVIRGRGGNDVICAGAGHDRVYGGPGNDRIYGGRGNDTLQGGRGEDRIFGGPGRDRIVTRPR